MQGNDRKFSSALFARLPSNTKLGFLMRVYERNKKVQSVDTEVVLIDIEKFSLLPANDQVIAAVIANGELEKFLALSSGQSAMNVDEVVAGFVITGDGFYVILQPSLIGYGLALGISLRSMLLNSSKENKKYLTGIRVGVHRGTLTAFEDITQRENYVGPVMNECARLLSAKPSDAPSGFLADSNYVICSKAAFDAFSKAYDYGDENSYFRQIGVKNSPWVTLTDKHGLSHTGTFVEVSRRIAFNPPRPPDFDARVTARLTKYLEPNT